MSFVGVGTDFGVYAGANLIIISLYLRFEEPRDFVSLCNEILGPHTSFLTLALSLNPWAD